VPGLILAVVNPDNTPHGYNWTFAFPMLLFIVIAAVLYALFSRPHRRVPGRRIVIASSQGSGGGGAPAGGRAAAAGRPSGASATTMPHSAKDGASQPEESTQADGGEAGE